MLISGKARHGKDTVAEMLKENLKARGYRAHVARYAGLVKYICKEYFDWNGEKDEAGRSLLQYVGTDAVRAKDPNYWCNFLVDIIKFFGDKWDYLIIPDCRFPNEIECMGDAGIEYVHIRVGRPDFESPLTEEQQKHPSETALDNYHYSYGIINDGSLDDLRDKVSSLAIEIIGYHQVTFDEVVAR